MSEAKGTPQRLYLFQVATSTYPTPNGGLELSAGCYLIQTDTGKNILIDSGYPADFEPSPGMSPAENEKHVLAHLADLGLSAADVDTVICTHFDVDHAGYHDAFPQAEFIVQREHYELARNGHARSADARPHWDHPALQYRLVDGDVEILPGLTLIKTSGHVPAHQSVWLRLPQTGGVLLAIDAVVMERLFTPERSVWPMDEDHVQLCASTQKLLDLVKRESIGLVIFGHDGRQWQTLKKSPEYYA